LLDMSEFREALELYLTDFDESTGQEILDTAKSNAAEMIGETANNAEDEVDAELPPSDEVLTALVLDEDNSEASFWRGLHESNASSYVEARSMDSDELLADATENVISGRLDEALEGINTTFEYQLNPKQGVVTFEYDRPLTPDLVGEFSDFYDEEDDYVKLGLTGLVSIDSIETREDILSEFQDKATEDGEIEVYPDISFEGGKITYDRAVNDGGSPQLLVSAEDYTEDLETVMDRLDMP
jgi:hypothetical protein